MGMTEHRIGVEKLLYGGRSLRVVEEGGIRRAVLGDVTRLLSLGAASKLAASVDPLEKGRAVLSDDGRSATTVSATGLVDVLRVRRTDAVDAFLEWAEEALFPLILGSSTLDAVSARLAEGSVAPLDWEASILPYEGGAESAYLFEDASSRTLWGSATQIAAVFGTTLRKVEMHLARIYAPGGLDYSRSTKRSFEMREKSGCSVRVTVVLHNFEAISAVGDRVSSIKAAAFIKWRTHLLEDVLTERTTHSDRLRARIEVAEGLLADCELREELVRLSGDPFPEPVRPSLTLDVFPDAGLTEVDREKIRVYLVNLRGHRRRCEAALRIVNAAERADGAPHGPAVEGLPDRVAGLIASRVARTDADGDPFSRFTINGAELPVLAIDPVDVGIADTFQLAYVREALSRGSDVVVLAGSLPHERLRVWLKAAETEVPGCEAALKTSRSGVQRGRLVVDRSATPSAGSYAADLKAVLAMPDGELRRLVGSRLAPEDPTI